MIKQGAKILGILCLLASVVCASENTTVRRVIDGDTLETAEGRKVRLVGINAPEIQDLFGQEAKEHLRTLVEGRAVQLVPDNTSSDQDPYQRLLRYVVLNDTDINKRMVEDGFAFAYLKYHFDRSNEYLEAEKKARAIGVGIWAHADNPDGKQRDPTGRYQSVRIYVVGALVFLLVCLGAYFYIRK